MNIDKILSKYTLDNSVDKICKTYNRLLKGELTQPSASESIGFTLSYLKQYEKEEGLDPDRIICVLPNCANIIKLRITYKMDTGYNIFRLDLEPHHINTYKIVVNTLEIEQEPENLMYEKMEYSEEESFMCQYKNGACCYNNKFHNNKCKD